MRSTLATTTTNLLPLLLSIVTVLSTSVPTTMAFNQIIKSAYFRIEKFVASKQIPSVDYSKRKQLNSDSTARHNSPTIDHSLWDALLQEYVYTGGIVGPIHDVNVVDYTGMGADNRFDQYLQTLANTKPDTITCNKELIAFWINCYNALCINLIVQYEKDQQHDTSKPQLKSITDLTKMNDRKAADPDKYTDNAAKAQIPVWDQAAGIVGGQTVSLNFIEHDMLRRQFDDPRIHACIICASASCPNLDRRAFTGEKVLDQMQARMEAWMTHKQKGISFERVEKPNLFDKSHTVSTLTLSRIFLWFQDDFDGFSGLKKYLPKYISDKDCQVALQSGKYDKLDYFEYDWTLNRYTGQADKQSAKQDASQAVSQ